MTDRPAPYGPLETHEPGCYLHEGGDFCDCENSDESAEGDRPAAPERDRWDEQAERELPCCTGMRCTQAVVTGKWTHSTDCFVSLRPIYAAGLRKAYSEGRHESADRMLARRLESEVEIGEQAGEIERLRAENELLRFTVERQREELEGQRAVVTTGNTYETGELIGGRRGEGTT